MALPVDDASAALSLLRRAPSNRSSELRWDLYGPHDKWAVPRYAKRQFVESMKLFSVCRLVGCLELFSNIATGIVMV